MSLLDSFSQIHQPRILVLGDLMLDRYTRGRANRTSQEAPVLVLTAEGREHRPGGAANVGLMLSVLEARVTCVGVVADDSPGNILRELLSRGWRHHVGPAHRWRPSHDAERKVCRSIRFRRA